MLPFDSSSAQNECAASFSQLQQEVVTMSSYDEYRKIGISAKNTFATSEATSTQTDIHRYRGKRRQKEAFGMFTVLFYLCIYLFYCLVFW